MQKCPICHNENFCYAEDISRCWCTKKDIPPALLEEIPVALRNKSCICVECIKKFDFKLAKNATTALKK